MKNNALTRNADLLIGKSATLRALLDKALLFLEDEDPEDLFFLIEGNQDAIRECREAFRSIANERTDLR
jgi:dsDNA-binding SOS-regulon protein